MRLSADDWKRLALVLLILFVTVLGMLVTTEISNWDVSQCLT